MSPLRRYLPAFTVAISVVALYLYDLNGVGVLSTDEPRYAAIGLEMARSHRFITPVLWGSPWFEKPPLLYWMTALGAMLGLGPETAGRVPVAVLSLAFLATTFVMLKREFGMQAAAASTALLATCAGWMAYSDLCLTDIPVAVFFSLAAFICLPLLHGFRAQSGARFWWIGVSLGLGVLAKGLVPIALAVPWFCFLRSYWRQWWKAALGCLLVALPWYVAVYAVNGWAFVQEFFIKHHIERLYSRSLEHVQPWWYYVPVLLLGLFPWTPAIAALCIRATKLHDRRRLFLLITALFGFVFFSISLNKLPGYLLPLLPAICALAGSAFENTPLSRLNRGLLLACATLIACIPLVANTIPNSLATGRFSLALGPNRTTIFYIAVPLVIVFVARRPWRAPLLVLALVMSAIYVKALAYPALDQLVSARQFYSTEIAPRADQICDDGTNRSWVYGIQFYLGRKLPYCYDVHVRWHLHSQGHEMPRLTEVNP